MKVILIAAISANGKIAEHVDQNSLDWTSKEDTHFFIQKTKEIGCMIMGQKTFMTINKPLKERLIVVLSDREVIPAIPGSLEYTVKPFPEILAELEARGFKEVAICGGASVYGAFMKAGLVDELYLTVEPVLFGGGLPLAENFGRINLELLGVEKLGEQSVNLHFKVKK
ncbi:MAG: dihydrofolate reductase family protein [bacterium]